VSCKSPRIDEITSEMIKAGRDCLTDHLRHLCNLIWKEGRMSKEWKKSILVTIPKKGNATECSNYRTIALVSHIGKLMMTVLTRRLQGQVEEHLTAEQAGFWKDRSTIQQILALRLIAEKAKSKGRTIYNYFVDFQKAFDYGATLAILQSYGVGTRLIDLLKNTNENAQAAVRVNNELGEWFNDRKGPDKKTRFCFMCSSHT